MESNFFIIPHSRISKLKSILDTESVEEYVITPYSRYILHNEKHYKCKEAVVRGDISDKAYLKIIDRLKKLERLDNLSIKEVYYPHEYIKAIAYAVVNKNGYIRSKTSIEVKKMVEDNIDMIIEEDVLRNINEWVEMLDASTNDFNMAAKRIWEEDWLNIKDVSLITYIINLYIISNGKKDTFVRDDEFQRGSIVKVNIQSYSVLDYKQAYAHSEDKLYRYRIEDDKGNIFIWISIEELEGVNFIYGVVDSKVTYGNETHIIIKTIT